MHERAEIAVDGSTGEVALFHLENEDGHVVFHAEGHGGGIHDLEATGNDFLVGDVVEARGGRVLDRVGRVDAVDLGGLHDDVAFAFDSAQRGTAVRREERVARTSGEDDHGTRGKELQGLAAVEEFADRFHADGGHHHGINTLLVEGVLHGEAVHHGAEHAHGIALGAVHAASRSRNAADEVAATDDESDLNALLDDGSNFACHVGEDDVIDTVALFACEGFATELQENTFEFRHRLVDSQWLLVNSFQS